MSIEFRVSSVQRGIIVDGKKTWAVILTFKGSDREGSYQQCAVQGLDPTGSVVVTVYGQGHEHDEKFALYCATEDVRKAIEEKMKPIINAYPDGPFPKDVDWVDNPSEVQAAAGSRNAVPASTDDQSLADGSVNDSRKEGLLDGASTFSTAEGSANHASGSSAPDETSNGQGSVVQGPDGFSLATEMTK